MITENLSTLKINKLSQAQYERELAAGNIDPNALYLTPDEEVDFSGYATKEDLETKADSDHSHSDYETKNDAEAKLKEANSYTDDAVAEKVSYVAQTLAEEQKAQARANIGAGVPQVQADYAQNDVIAPDYIKNRLAWTEGSLEVLLSTTLDIMEDYRQDYNYCNIDIPNLIEGETYIVCWDDDEYSCLCYRINLNGDDHLVLGNANICDSNKNTTGEPFFIVEEYPVNDIVHVLYTLLDGVVTLDIYKPIEVIHKIDEKYIPDTIARVADVNVQLEQKQPVGDYALKSDVKVTSVNGQTGDVTIDKLPAVTTSDSGKFLRVSADGTWVAETIPHIEEVAF